MEVPEIKAKIKQIVFETTNIEPSEIGDNDSFTDDLMLDSLTLLEIAVNIDQEFGLDMPEEDMKGFASVSASATIVGEQLAQKAA